MTPALLIERGSLEVGATSTDQSVATTLLARRDLCPPNAFLELAHDSIGIHLLTLHHERWNC